ncbi:MAG: glutathione S-transferase family protein [Proteobacteria bacterium]|nr:glutathione S-transferase family protein [Pseudomonadota bacterium]
MPDDIELLHFNYSHYNEKARWALDYKGVPHTRTSFLPGPHMPAIKKRTGQTQTPVVRFGDEHVHGSARIIGALEHRFPQPPLYPQGPAERDKALKIQRFFDDNIGPGIRRSTLMSMIPTGSHLCNSFARDKGAVTRFFYRATFPFARGLIEKGNGITGPESFDDAVVATQEGFDFIVNNLTPSGYLVGDRFTLADLAAASIMAVAMDPPHPDMERPKPLPTAMTEWLNRWADHPGTDWVRTMYRRHRSNAG